MSSPKPHPIAEAMSSFRAAKNDAEKFESIQTMIKAARPFYDLSDEAIDEENDAIQNDIAALDLNDTEKLMINTVIVGCFHEALLLGKTEDLPDPEKHPVVNYFNGAKDIVKMTLHDDAHPDLVATGSIVLSAIAADHADIHPAAALATGVYADALSKVKNDSHFANDSDTTNASEALQLAKMAYKHGNEFYLQDAIDHEQFLALANIKNKVIFENEGEEKAVLAAHEDMNDPAVQHALDMQQKAVLAMAQQSFSSNNMMGQSDFVSTSTSPGIQPKPSG